MKILVIGGAGFVGSNLCKRLIEDKNTVISLDNYSVGTRNNHIKNVTYIKGDSKDIEKLINESVNLIFHLGEYSRVEQSFLDIEKVIDSNINGTAAVLEFWRKQKCKLVYAGSSTKFSNDSGRDSSPYAYTKSSNTELVKNYASWFNLPYAISYFYNVYGKNEVADGNYATLIAIFKKRFLEGKNLSVVEPGSQRRNFTYIDDIIDALMLIGDKATGDEYGIGADESYSVLDIASLFKRKIDMLPPRRGNRMGGKVLTEKTKDLGWSPKTKIEDHIYEFIKKESK
jgi:UDP-glucose 4-epimerase